MQSLSSQDRRGEAAACKSDLVAVKATVDFAMKVGRFNTEGQGG